MELQFSSNTKFVGSNLKPKFYLLLKLAKNMKKTLIFAVVLFTSFSTSNCSEAPTKSSVELYIRLSQVGFLPSDIKSGIVLTNENFENEKFFVVDQQQNVAFTGTLGQNTGPYGKFKNSYVFEFSQFRQFGTFYINLKDNVSYKFRISSKVFNPVVDSLMQFFRVQRSGYTEPYLHGTSHIADATSLIDGEKRIAESFDVTGGWYDAGDYIKFFNTTAYATYTLLFSYEFAPNKFSFDNNKNNVPDVLEEAKVGLDWLLRAQYKGEKFVTQVQDMRDHDVGWRLPEDDPLTFDRPAYLGIGKNLIGIFTAAMSLASRIWTEKFHYAEFADQCLTAAENYYSIRNEVPNVDSSGSGFYIDKLYAGKLALGAAEMYLTTNQQKYLDDAVEYADIDGSEVWWSWGNIAAYAHYRLAKIYPRFADYLVVNLESFDKNKDGKVFNEGAAYTWGTNNLLLGITLQNILYYDLKRDHKYDRVAIDQRDYILGRNPWGVCFISGIGTDYTRNFHNQIAHFNNGYLPGGFAAGPIGKEYLDSSQIPYEDGDRFEKFQTEEAVYRDDRMDYVTNEPTITANATAVFVMGNFSNR